MIGGLLLLTVISWELSHSQGISPFLTPELYTREAAVRKIKGTSYNDVIEIGEPHYLNALTRESVTASPEVASQAKKGANAIKEMWQRLTITGVPVPCFKASSFGNSSICGSVMITFGGRLIYAFKGIKYASNKRFEEPIAVGKYWQGSRLNATTPATAPPSMCPQVDSATNLVVGEEDCLSLNVFTPQLPQGSLNQSYPVMVYIHGGAFVTGTKYLYSPSVLLDKDVILVTINYRLGPLGFMSLNKEEAKGNYGLYDQIEALKWVNKHIEDFGGNKNKVTIMGQSAGAASVNYLLLAKQATGLFHGAILQSGTAMDKWAFAKDTREVAFEIAKNVNCTSALYPDVIDCMRNVPFSDIILSATRFKASLGYGNAVPSVQSPNVKNPLLLSSPIKLIEGGQTSDVPLMLGATKHDGSLAFGFIFTTYLRPQGLHLNSTYLRNYFIPDLIKDFDIRDPNGAVATSMQSAYCKGVDLANFTAAASCVTDMLSVLMHKAGPLKLAKHHSLSNHSDVYLYSFDYGSNITFFDYFIGPVEFPTGVSHSDDLFYLFPLAPSITEAYIKTKTKMVELWTNFATYGDPTPIEDAQWQLLNISKWNPFNNVEQNYLSLGESFTAKDNYMDSWTTKLN